MIYTSVLTKRAQQDIHKAAFYYKQIQPKLAKEFVREVRLVGAFLCKRPVAFQIRNNPPVRCVPLRKFPFMIHYFPIEKTKQVVILAVLHTLDDPKKWP